jgi:hypothetical protein
MNFKLVSTLLVQKLAGSRDRKEPELTPVAKLSKAFAAAAKKQRPTRAAIVRRCCG